MRQIVKRATRLLALTLMVSAWGCSSTKHVPDGKYLLDKVKIEVDGSSEVKPVDLYYYLRQTPNHKVLGFAKLQLSTYSLSGRDSTKWYNRWLQKIGQAPVIYDRDLTDGSVLHLERSLQNQGYLDARVSYDTIARPDKKRMEVVYHVHPGVPHSIETFDIEIIDPTIDSIVRFTPRLVSVKQGDNLDRGELDQMRASIAQRLRQNGYYTFTKENVSFIADTTANSKGVALTMLIDTPKHLPGGAENPDSLFRRFYFGKVTYITDLNARRPGVNPLPLDTVDYKGLTIIYGPEHYLKPKVLDENCFITPGTHYSTIAIDRTYEALGRLGILKFVNIQLTPRIDPDGRDILDVTILLDSTKKRGIIAELEGTNSEGDLGFGVGVTYQNRNLAHGSELLTAKARASYESLSGNVDGLLNNRYSEYAGEIGITMPKFQAPFLSREFKRSIRATTEFTLSGNYQERPEYTRVIAGGAWKYNWANRQNTERRTFDLIDINYVYLPKSTINFIESVAPSNPLLRYSYEDHFIMRMGYTYRRTNRRIASAIERTVRQPSIYSLRASGEMAGNLLWCYSRLFDEKKDDGAYRIFGIQYAQYVKGEFDYAYTRNFDPRNSFAVHFGFGIEYPYGNSSMVPFEKRFYAGGANSVRGWSARALGPGAYDARNDAIDFINQCGDISLIASIEYRAKLFWLLEGALFIDAGNIWTIQNYENQPYGFFRFKEFYKQIAAAYGAGLRLDFTYFLLRFDLGVKAHNPANGQEEWPMLHPRWRRDVTLHFAVGYPF